jgi:hypothetical protein
MKVSGLLRLVVIMLVAMLIQACGGSKAPAPSKTAPLPPPPPPAASRSEVETLYRKCTSGETSSNTAAGLFRATGYNTVSAELGLRALDFAISSSATRARAQLAATFATSFVGTPSSDARQNRTELTANDMEPLTASFTKVVRNAPLICVTAFKEDGKYDVMVVVETRVNSMDAREIQTEVRHNTGQDVTLDAINQWLSRLGQTQI